MRHTRTLDGFVVGDVVFTGYMSAPAAIKYAGAVGVIPHYIKVVEVSDDLSIKDIKELIDQSEPTSLYALDLAKEVTTLEKMVVAESATEPLPEGYHSSKVLAESRYHAAKVADAASVTSTKAPTRSITYYDDSYAEVVVAAPSIPTEAPIRTWFDEHYAQKEVKAQENAA